MVEKQVKATTKARNKNLGSCFMPCLVLVVFADFVQSADLNKISLQELMNIKVVTPSRKNQSAAESPANITIITSDMIDRRGYKNLFEVLSDVPGFDFSTFEDGGGEYPGHTLLRGIGGDPGNSKLMIMIDNMIQNHIAFNWALGWSDARQLHNIERIEVIQGPASVLYGANAMSGVVHLITKKRQNNTMIQIGSGEHNTRAVNLLVSRSDNNWDMSLAGKLYKSDGDGGIDRADPGGYFSDNVQPNIILNDYDTNGNYLTSISNLNAGQALPDGFNNSKDDWAASGHLFYFPDEGNNFYLKKIGVAANIWDKQDGLGSYITGYEYHVTDDDFLVHHRNSYLYGEAEFGFSDAKTLKVRLWRRENRQMPATGFRYTYQYPQLRKSYHSLSSQRGTEAQLDIPLADERSLTLGVRYLNSDKSNQIISLGGNANVHDRFTNSSWALATSALSPVLGQFEAAQIKNVNERAVYGEYHHRFNNVLGAFLGLRYDNSDAYGHTTNSNLALIANMPVDKWHLPFLSWNTKLLFGEAFREPSIFELSDEFRGDASLKPETSKTLELLNEFRWLASDKLTQVNEFKLSVSGFFTRIEDTISLVDDLSSASGRTFTNAGTKNIKGLSAQLDVELSNQLYLYVNYQFIYGKNESEDWQPIDNTAHIKWNGGINWLTWNEQLNVNVRVNHVGRRKAPTSNSYFEDFAPSYNLVNLALTFQPDWLERHSITIRPQLVVKNLLDKQWFGLGRQGGVSEKSLWDADTNPNPPGFSPPYHPQYGRTWMFNVMVSF